MGLADLEKDRRVGDISSTCDVYQVKMGVSKDYNSNVIFGELAAATIEFVDCESKIIDEFFDAGRKEGLPEAFFRCDEAIVLGAEGMSRYLSRYQSCRKV